MVSQLRFSRPASTGLMITSSSTEFTLMHVLLLDKSKGHYLTRAPEGFCHNMEETRGFVPQPGSVVLWCHEGGDSTQPRSTGISGSAVWSQCFSFPPKCPRLERKMKSSPQGLPERAWVCHTLISTSIPPILKLKLSLRPVVKLINLC